MSMLSKEQMEKYLEQVANGAKKALKEPDSNLDYLIELIDDPGAVEHFVMDGIKEGLWRVNYSRLPVGVIDP